MKEMTEGQLRDYLTKRTENSLVDRWAYNGAHFSKTGHYFQGEYFVVAEYVCTFKTLHVMLKRWSGEDYEPFAEASFDNDNAIKECVEWVVDTLMEYYLELYRRVSPYLAGHIAYQRALKGEMT